MGKVLLDTSVLLRTFQELYPWNRVAKQAVEILRCRGCQLHTVPQNSYEFWAVATRPVEQNGLGFSIADLAAAADAHGLKAILTFDKTGFSRFPEIEVIDPASLLAGNSRPS